MTLWLLHVAGIGQQRTDLGLMHGTKSPNKDKAGARMCI
jgi:hypothetical protein